MTETKHKTPKDRLKNRRDIGRVVFPMEIMNAARELSSCCIGTEAKLEPKSRFRHSLQRHSDRAPSDRRNVFSS